MLSRRVSPLLQEVRRLATSASSDEQLLGDYRAGRSDEAFAAILGRHGAMVLQVCRRILHDEQAAEDVFQATFLVLANRAVSIRRPDSLASFLHGVAYRLAVRARQKRLPSLPTEVYDGTVGPPDELAWKEMLQLLDTELSRLPDRYRSPLVLCYLEGRTQDEAARQLGWSLNTLRRRVVQGRQLLEARLRGRGVTLSAAMAGVLAAGAAAVPGSLRAATLTAVATQAVGAAEVCAALLPPSRRGIGLFLSSLARKSTIAAMAFVLGAVVCLGYCLNPQEPSGGEQAVSASTPAPEDRNPMPESVIEPLPNHSLLRLGTARYRHGGRIDSFSVSSDSRLVAVASGSRSFAPARVFDLTEGRCLTSLPRDHGPFTEAVALSPDGRFLVTKHERELCLREATTGKVIRKIPFISDAGGGRSVVDWLTFSPDGKLLASILLGQAVSLIDVESGKVIRTFAPAAAASACVFSPDGRWLATGGYEKENDAYLARLWDIDTGTELRRFPTGNFPGGNGGRRALAFSPDGATLAGGGWGDARLWLWDTKTGKVRQVLPQLGDEIRSVVFAPDGKSVVAAADQIVLYDSETGKERHRIDRRARALTYSKDGTVLVGAVSGAIYRWDAKTGRQLTPETALNSAVEQLLVGADNRQLFTIDQEGGLHAWDVAGKLPPRRVADNAGRGAVASTVGRLLAWTVQDKHGGSRIRVYDQASQRLLDHFPVFADIANVEGVLPDGKTILTLDTSSTKVRLWDVASGKERRSFAAYPERGPRTVNMIQGAPRQGVEFPYFARRAALSPDGKILAIGELDSGQPVGLWDVTTGKKMHDLEVRLTSVHSAADRVDPTSFMGFMGRRLTGYLSSGNGLTFSADGRFVVTWSEDPFGRSDMDHVSVWDAATGQAVAKLLTNEPIGAGSVAYAPDGRTLATASADGVLRLWETATWKVRAEFRGHRDQITSLAFGPDGRLYSGGFDTVVLGWNLRPALEGTDKPLAEAWEALTTRDAKLGFQAQGRFLAEPEKAVEWLSTRLRPANPLDAARRKTLIANLGDDDFATREAAMEDLREYGAAAVPALRDVVAQSASAETRRRGESLIQEIAQGVISARELRMIRAVEILEWLATKEAVAHLRELAKGDRDARLTREAVAAWKRREGSQ